MKHSTYSRFLAQTAVIIAVLNALDLGAQIYVVNSGNGTVGEYSLSGALINPTLITGLKSPGGIAVSGGHIYLAEQSTIKEFSTSGALINGALVSGLNMPGGIAVSGNYLYVANSGSESSTVGKYTTSGETVNASLITGLGNPAGVAVDGDTLYVTEWHTGKVGKYTTSGGTITTSLLPILIYPGGVLVDGAGNLYISTLDHVGKFTSAGATVNAALIPAGYNSGGGLAFDGQGHLLWANNYGGVGGNRIGLYSTTGELLNASFITGLQNPIGIAVVPEPSSLIMLSLGGLALLYRRGRQV